MQIESLIVTAISLIIGAVAVEKTKTVSLKKKNKNDRQNTSTPVAQPTPTDSNTRENVSKSVSQHIKIIDVIVEMNYLLDSEYMDENGNYEIVVLNYINKTFDFRRPPTCIKLTGHADSTDVTYSTWSYSPRKINNRSDYSFTYDTTDYKYQNIVLGQNSHNEKVAKIFMENLKRKNEETRP